MEQNVTTAYNTEFPVYDRPAAPAMSVGDWIISMLVVCIPLVGFIMLFVWAFGSSTNPSKASWAKANLIFMLIFMVIGFLFAGTIMTALMQASGRS